MELEEHFSSKKYEFGVNFQVLDNVAAEAAKAPVAEDDAEAA